VDQSVGSFAIKAEVTGIHMVGPSTTRALNKRALRTADWLHYHAKRLEDELEKQKINVDAKQILRDYDVFGGRVEITKSDGSPVMVVLETSVMISLIVHMYREEAELRRFAEPVKSRRR
jgi:hypothetical protein